MMDILTEAEARTRKCPFMFRENPLKQMPKDGKDLEIVPPEPCIASDCMAWRLAHKDAADGTERGYCGAFGLPRFT